MKIVLSLVTSLMVFAIVGCSPGEDASPISVADGWIRPAPPGAVASAGYFTMTNHSASAMQVTSVRSDDFGRVEVHETRMQDGAMQMRAVPALKIAPDTTISLAPGGLHLMLFDPRGDVTELERVRLTLYDGERPIADLDLPVSARNPYE